MEMVHVVLRGATKACLPSRGIEKGRNKKVRGTKTWRLEFADLHSLMCQWYMKKTYESHGPAVGFPSVINT